MCSMRRTISDCFAMARARDPLALSSRAVSGLAVAGLAVSRLAVSRLAVSGLAVSGLALFALALTPSGAAAQVEPPPPPPDGEVVEVEVVPGAEYEAGPIHRFILGDGYRDIWTRPLTVQVLDVRNFAGGLIPEERGGNQTRTLHFVSNDDRGFIFRSVNKWASGALPRDLRGTILNDLIQDFISATHPGGAFVVWPLQEELGILTEPMILRVMPDDPALGEFREMFAGMLGQVALKSNEGEGDTPGTWGYRKITGSDALLDRLEENPRHRVATRELLRAKLLDFLVGDTDRGLNDQWRWAGEPVEDGFRWRPIPRDRDWSFIDAQGPVGWLIHQFYEKVTEFDDDLASVDTYVWQDEGLSRRLLTDLDRREWQQVTDEVIRTLSDDVIEQAVRQLPEGMQPGHAEWLSEKLKQRREGLAERSAEYYAWLATDVDVRATDIDDRLEVTRNVDGSVDVALYAPADELVAVFLDEEEDEEEEAEQDGATTSADATADGSGADGGGWAPYYQRRFLPSETDEVRIFLHGGDDRAVVRGEGSGDVVIRVIGGGGDDELIDTGAASHLTAFYDARGDNRIAPGPRTHVDTRAYEDPEQGEGFFETRTGDNRIRDWGTSLSPIRPTADYREGAGLILGVGPTWTEYGFRTHPYETRLEARALYATGSGGFGVEGRAVARIANSPVRFEVNTRATQFEAMRFYGYGNDAPYFEPQNALIMQDQVRLAPAVVVEKDAWEGRVGPLLLYTDPDVAGLGPAVDGLLGSDAFGQVGAQAAFEVDLRDREMIPTRGLAFTARTAAFPGVWDAPDAFGQNDAEARGYVPLGSTVLALRAGGRHAWGTFPLHASARIGGGATLRGYRWERFAGDAALYGGAELRVPLFRMELLTKGRLGVLGLADAGRVYVDGESPGGWHTGYGAGLWFATLGQAVNVVWARGEEDRVYVGLGLPY